jgi:hypothetical protein
LRRAHLEWFDGAARAPTRTRSVDVRADPRGRR